MTNDISTIRLASLIAYAFATDDNPCPMSDAALSEIESAAIALAQSLGNPALESDSLTDLCADIGSEIACLCCDGHAPLTAPDWHAFIKHFCGLTP